MIAIFYEEIRTIAQKIGIPKLRNFPNNFSKMVRLRGPVSEQLSSPLDSSDFLKREAFGDYEKQRT